MLRNLHLVHQGKVRDVYAADDMLLFVATDRISAFDVILPTLIPDKGRLLNMLSLFWFDLVSDLVPGHIVGTNLSGLKLEDDEKAWLQDRSVVVRRANVLPVECVVRGYLAGSAWADYRRCGAVSGIALPAGLEKAQKLPEPVFTPATKAAPGSHDENISFSDVADRIGAELADEIRTISLKIYDRAALHARDCGLILADTKFEFGLVDGVLHLVDECLTSDSSRFWSIDGYRTGISPPAYDKQIVRDWLDTVPDWNRTHPGPTLPDTVVRETRARYITAFERLTGRKFVQEPVQNSVDPG